MATWCTTCEKFIDDKEFCDYCKQKTFKALNFHYKDITCNLETIENGIEKIFGKDMFSKTDLSKNKINLILNQIKKAYLKNNFEHAIANIGKLLFFIQNMEEIRDYDIKTFEETRDMLMHHIHNTTFYGFRFEALITSTFIRQNINFKKREAPDFEVVYNHEDYHVECTSVRFEKAASINEIELKINRKILQKNNKAYANNKTMLFIDITHMYGLESEVKGNMYLKQITENIKKNLHQYKFKCILLFIGLYDRENVRYFNGNIKIYNEDLDINLKNLLHLMFPGSTEKINHSLAWKEM